MDNASSNVVVIDYLKKQFSKKKKLVLDGKFFHLRCCAHILNLIVKDDMYEIQDSTSAIRASVKYVKSSPQRAQHFKSCVELEGIACKSTLCLDVPTRWNSTYLMLDCALNFQKAFERMEEQEPLFKYELNLKLPTSEDWDNARVLVKFLKHFFYATKTLSSSLHVSSNCYFDEFCKIEGLLNTWCKHSDSCLSVMAIKMLAKFDKYWGKLERVNFMLVAAVVLDPCYRVRYFKFCFERVYDEDKVNELLAMINERMKLLFEHYEKLHACTSSPCKDQANLGFLNA